MKRKFEIALYSIMLLALSFFCLSSCTTSRMVKGVGETLRFAKTFALADLAESHQPMEFLYQTDSAGRYYFPDKLLTIETKPIDSISQQITIRFNWVESWLPVMEQAIAKHIKEGAGRQAMLYAVKLAFLELAIQHPSVTGTFDAHTTQNTISDRLGLITVTREPMGNSWAKATIRINWIQGVDKLLNQILDKEIQKLSVAITKGKGGK